MMTTPKLPHSNAFRACLEPSNSSADLAQGQLQGRNCIPQQRQPETEDVLRFQPQHVQERLKSTLRHRITWISQTCELLMYLDIGEAPGYLRRMKNLVDSFLS